MRHGKLVFEYDRILPGIIVGTNQCCIMHFRSELVKNGVLADLSLESDRIDAAWGAKYFLWLPVRDHHAPTMKQFILGVGFLRDCVTNGLHVYVHCQRGHGRAPTMVAAYLCAAKGMAPGQAVAYIKRKRPGVHPNRGQMAALRRYAAFVRRSGTR